MRTLIIFLTVFAASFTASSARAEEFDARVYRVVDGDSFKFERLNALVEDECRMLHYNAPEMTGEERPLGRKAFKKMMGLIKFRDVKIKAEKRDKYGRLLCEVTLRDGTDVNALMRRWLTEELKYPGVGRYDWKEAADD